MGGVFLQIYSITVEWGEGLKGGEGYKVVGVRCGEGDIRFQINDFRFQILYGWTSLRSRGENGGGRRIMFSILRFLDI